MNICKVNFFQDGSVFQSAFVTGWTFNEFPAFANTLTLAVIVVRHQTNIEQVIKLRQYPKIYLYKRIVQAKLFIDTNYADKIDIDHISDEAFFSKFHFIRLFKQIYGNTPYQYLTSVRIENAKLLFQQDRSVSEVCYLVGFESLSSFSGLFKKSVGVSPSTFLVQAQSRQKEILQNPLHYISGCFAYKLGWTKLSNFEEA